MLVSGISCAGFQKPRIANCRLAVAEGKSLGLRLSKLGVPSYIGLSKTALVKQLRWLRSAEAEERRFLFVCGLKRESEKYFDGGRIKRYCRGAK